MTKRQQIAIVHPQIRWGGGEAVAFWTIKALKDNYDVTLVTNDKVNVSTINSFYGTELKENDFEIMRTSIPVLLRGKFFWLIKQHLAIRYIKSRKNDFGIIISTFNEMDFGKLGIQYIHFPILNDKGLHSTSQFKKYTWFHERSLMRKVYRRLCASISGFSVDSMKQNITLVNSRWTGQIVKSVYGIETRVVYPPVKNNFDKTPWEKREDGFLCIGRISPEKRIETVIGILSKVRDKISNIHLHIIGPVGDIDYYNKIERMVRGNSSWITLECELGRDELLYMLSKHKFGIHAMQNEHFGIVVAEMVKAGCIPFVPNDGGQVEIVDHRLLTYDDESGAVAKIFSVLKNYELQQSIRSHLVSQSTLFSEDKFIGEIQEVVRGLQT